MDGSTGLIAILAQLAMLSNSSFRKATHPACLARKAPALHESRMAR